MSLHLKLSTGVGIALVCTMLLAGLVAARYCGEYQASRQALSDVEQLRDVLDMANALSAERGPANSVMGEAPSATGASARRLAEFRARNDAALARLGQSRRLLFGLESTIFPPALIDGVKDDLAAARAEVDRIASLPLADRDMASTRHTIRHMFGVVDGFREVTRTLAADLRRRDPSLKSSILAGEMLGDLREYAGRIASQIIPSVAIRQPLPYADLTASAQTRGRLAELWALLGERGSLDDDDARIREGRDDVERAFFHDGLAIFDSMVEQGLDSGHYSLTVSDFTSRFVATIAPIEHLRTTYLNVLVDKLTKAKDHAFRVLLAVGAYIAITLAVLFALIGTAQRRVFKPLLLAREDVIGLAEDRMVRPHRRLPGEGEMRRLFDAIDALRGKMVERSALLEQLKQQAETDGLTGLLNRRALDRLGEMAAATGTGTGSLILIDLDHFKRVNDRHGHLAGDQVLRQVARLLQSAATAGAVVARFGGEEFAILLPDDRAAAVSLARRLRLALQATGIDLDGGERLTVTASFGVAAFRPGGPDWVDLLSRADAALYRAKSDGRNRVRCDGPVIVEPHPRSALHWAI